MLCTFLQTPCLILHYCPLVVGLVTVSCKWLPIKILHFYSVLLQAIIITINILEPVKCWLTGRKEDKTGLVLYALSHWAVKSNMSRIRPEARSSMVGSWQTEKGEGRIFCSFSEFGCFIIRVVASCLFLFPSEIFLLLRTCQGC